MHAHQISWTQRTGWTRVAARPEDISLVFYFGARQTLACGSRYEELRSLFPTAHILGCSTGGQKAPAK